MVTPATADLICAARRGSSDAFDALFARYGGRLLALIRLRTGRALRARVDSGDVLQATLLKSFQHFASFEGQDGPSLVAWLATIAGNEVRDQADFHGRARRRMAADVPLDGPDAAGAAAAVRSPLSVAIAAQEAERVADALAALEADHRQVIILRRFEERSFKEIAAIMGRSDDACRMLLGRALAALTIRLRSG